MKPRLSGAFVFPGPYQRPGGRGLLAMVQTPQDEIVQQHVARWKALIIHTKKWDRRKFLMELWAAAPAYPGAVELADRFDKAVTQARGSSERFQRAVADLG
jgi:hypothetical protein